MDEQLCNVYSSPDNIKNDQIKQSGKNALGNLSKFLNHNQVTELRGRVVYTPTSYSGGPAFDSRPRRPAILTDVFSDSPQSLQANAGRVP
jgi:hypothetical protein